MRNGDLRTWWLVAAACFVAVSRLTAPLRPSSGNRNPVVIPMADTVSYADATGISRDAATAVGMLQEGATAKRSPIMEEF